jgi:hypothetical protein
MIEFIGTSSKLQLIITAHTFNSFWILLRVNRNSSLKNLSLSCTMPDSRLNFWSLSLVLCQSASLSWNKAPITVRQLRVCWCGALSLTRGRVCRLQLLLSLASAVFLGSESRGTRDHILLSHIRDFALLRLLRVRGSRWRYSTPPQHGSLHRIARIHGNSFKTIRCHENVFSGLYPSNGYTRHTAPALRLFESMEIPPSVLVAAKRGLTIRCVAIDYFVTLFSTHKIELFVSFCPNISPRCHTVFSALTVFAFPKLFQRRTSGQCWSQSL